jgi:hypothetical protein
VPVEVRAFFFEAGLKPLSGSDNTAGNAGLPSKSDRARKELEYEKNQRA